MKTLIYVSGDYDTCVEAAERYGIKKLADELLKKENAGKNEGYANKEVFDEEFQETIEFFAQAKQFDDVDSDVVNFLSGFMDGNCGIYMVDEKGKVS